jgi:hypothetical protein
MRVVFEELIPKPNSAVNVILQTGEGKKINVTICDDLKHIGRCCEQ